MTRFKSLRELSEQLTGVRLSAANTSIWSMGATISERARVAINDAVAQFPVMHRGMYFSATLSSEDPIVIPNNVRQVVSVKAKTASGVGVVEVTDFRLVPTALTNLLYVDRLPRASLDGAALEIETREELYEFPANVALSENLPAGPSNYFNITGGVTHGVWQYPGYLEITMPPHISTDVREVIRYEFINANTFSNITRTVEGQMRTWPAGSVVSFIQIIPDRAKPIIEKAAQASMYDYWMSHRAQYDQFSAVAGIAQLDIGSLLAIVRTYQADAERRYEALTTEKIPPVTKVRKRGRRGVS